MKKSEIKVIKNEIMNAKNQYQIADIVDTFDDSCDIDLHDDVYSESDMEDNINDMDDFHEPSEIKDPSKYPKDQLKLWEYDAHILDRLADDDYPKDDDLFFYEDGNPVSMIDMEHVALSMLSDNAGAVASQD